MAYPKYDDEPLDLLAGAVPADDLFRLQGSVGAGASNDRDDVIRAQILLGNAGYYDLAGIGGPTGWPGGELTRAIRSYQADRGLTPDGVMLPLQLAANDSGGSGVDSAGGAAAGVDTDGRGETIAALRGELGGRLLGRRAPGTAAVNAHFDRRARRAGPDQPYDSPIAMPETGAEGEPLGVLKPRADAPALNMVLTGILPPGHDKEDPSISGTPMPHRPWRTAQDAVEVPFAAPGDPVAAADAVPEQPAAPGAPPPAVPPHKDAVFRHPDNAGAWQGYHDSLATELPDRPVLRDVLRGIYAEEGGRLADPDSGAVGGITPGTLADLYRRGRLPDLPPGLAPADLTPAQQAHVHRAYFDDALHTVGGSAALEQLDPAIARATAEALFMDGRRAGTRFLQEAINNVGVDAKITEDGKMGPQTINALNGIGLDPVLSEAFRRSAADAMIEGKPRSKGEIDRINRLRPRRDLH